MHVFVVFELEGLSP